MADDLVSRASGWFFYLIVSIVVLGSLVDLIQFSWIIKKQMRRVRKRMYDRVRREILLEQHDRGYSNEKDKQANKAC